jgi:PAS domain S-box-containing protein
MQPPLHPSAEKQLARLLQHWPGAIFEQRADFSIAQATAGFEEFTGLAPGECDSQPPRFWELVHEADVEELQRHCLQSPRAPGGLALVYRVRHVRTGKVAYVREHREALFGKAGEVLGYQVLWVDVTP